MYRYTMNLPPKNRGKDTKLSKKYDLQLIGHAAVSITAPEQKSVPSFT